MLSKFSNVSASRARRTIKASEGIEVAHWHPLHYYLHFIFTPLVTFQFKTKSNENYFTKKTCESICRKKKNQSSPVRNGSCWEKGSCVALSVPKPRSLWGEVLRHQSASSLYAKLKLGIIYETTLLYFTTRYIYLLTAFFLEWLFLACHVCFRFFS